MQVLIDEGTTNQAGSIRTYTARAPREARGQFCFPETDGSGG